MTLDGYPQNERPRNQSDNLNAKSLSRKSPPPSCIFPSGSFYFLPFSVSIQPVHFFLICLPQTNIFQAWKFRPSFPPLPSPPPKCQMSFFPSLSVCESPFGQAVKVGGRAWAAILNKVRKIGTPKTRRRKNIFVHSGWEKKRGDLNACGRGKEVGTQSPKRPNANHFYFSSPYFRFLFTRRKSAPKERKDSFWGERRERNGSLIPRKRGTLESHTTYTVPTTRAFSTLPPSFSPPLRSRRKRMVKTFSSPHAIAPKNFPYSTDSRSRREEQKSPFPL